MIYIEGEGSPWRRFFTLVLIDVHIVGPMNLPPYVTS